MQTSSPNAREPHESAPRLDAPTRTVSTDTRPCSRFSPRYLPLRLSSLMHKYVARRPRVTEPSRNWEIPSLLVSRSGQVRSFSLFLAIRINYSIISIYSKYKKIITLLYIADTIIRAKCVLRIFWRVRFADKIWGGWAWNTTEIVGKYYGFTKWTRCVSSHW